MTFASFGRTRGLALRLKGAIGLTIMQLTLGWRMIPFPRERLYAVEPVELEIRTPSAENVVAKVSLT